MRRGVLSAAVIVAVSAAVLTGCSDDTSDSTPPLPSSTTSTPTAAVTSTTAAPSATTTGLPTGITDDEIVARLSQATFGFDGIGPLQLDASATDLRDAGWNLISDDCGTLHKIRLSSGQLVQEVLVGVDPDSGAIVRVDVALLPETVPSHGIAKSVQVLDFAQLGGSVETVGSVLEREGATALDRSAERLSWQLRDASGRVMVFSTYNGVLNQVAVANDLETASRSYCA